MLTLSPIGIIRTPYNDRYRAPRQPGTAAHGAEGVIELDAGMNYEQALEDIAGFERIWVIYWFDRNTTWKPKVRPPRGSDTKRGLFATRSPHRPNPLGLSLLRLVAVHGRTLHVADVDLLDGTPILDIKPYLPYAEAFPDARCGWLEELADTEPHYEVRWTEHASAQAAWLAERGVDIASVAKDVLARHAAPHPYRRISTREDGTLELAVQSWRVVFRNVEERNEIARIESGYTREQVLAPEAAEHLHEGAVHTEFYQVWEEYRRDGS